MNQNRLTQSTPKRLSPSRLSAAILQRKCNCGNHVSAHNICQQCLDQKARPQRRLAIGKSRDPLEQEADRIAGQVLRSPQHSVAGHTPLRIQRHAGLQSGDGIKPPNSVDRALSSTGKPLDPALQQDMGRRFGYDFSPVRIHTNQTAEQSARELGAQAYTVGNNIVFAKGEFSPNFHRGRNLLAHELTHVIQQSSVEKAFSDKKSVTNNGHPSAPTPGSSSRRIVQCSVSPDWERIESNLSYGLLDWAIRDYEASEVLEILSTLSDIDLADTVGAMDREGLLERLLDNISTEDEERHAVLIGRITRYRSVSHTSARIMDRLSRGFFDWAVTDADAREALHTLMGLDYQQLRTVVAHLVNNGGFDTLMDELPAEEHQRFAAFINRLREIRNEFTALVSSHTAFLRSQPGGAGRTVRTTVDTTGYGSSRATWSDLSPEQQREWRRRAAAAIASVIASVRGTDLEDIVSRSHFDFSPENAERLNAFAYVSGTNTLQFGRSWVRNAESNPVNVWQSIAHELGGHEEFGSTWSWEIMRGTLRRMTAEERRVALGSANNLYSAYGYLETEIYAELRELPYRIATSRGDRPDSTPGNPGDVHDKLVKIKNAFGEEVGRQIVLRLYYRVMGDPRVSDAAKRLLRTETQTVFHLFPITEPVNP